MSDDPEDPDNIQEEAILGVFSAYDLPYVEALVKYFHVAAGYPVQDIWIKAIKAGNYESWPGITYNNAAKYCPSSDETTKRHMVQTCQNLRSTKSKKKESEADRIKKQFTGSVYVTKKAVSPEGITIDGRASTW